jgi:hypothetical protein
MIYVAAVGGSLSVTPTLCDSSRRSLAEKCMPGLQQAALGECVKTGISQKVRCRARRVKLELAAFIRCVVLP